MYIHVHEADYSNIIKTACLKKKKKSQYHVPNPINWFNPTTFVCLSPVRKWISNIICHGISCVQGVEVKADFFILLIFMELLIKPNNT